MSVQSRLRLFGTTVAAVGVGAVAVGSGVAPAETSAPLQITPQGVDGVKLGKRYIQLRRQGLIGRIRMGCELSGPDARSARLKAPLRGSVDFTRTSPRRVTAITIRRGARARGVGVGSKIPAIKAAFPKAKVDHSTDQVFGVTLVRIPKNGGGKLMFAVSTDTKRTTLIGIPRIPFCE